MPRTTTLVLAAVGVVAYGVSGYLILGNGFVDAIYRTGLTLTTVGFSSEQAPARAEKLFTTSVAMVGVLLYLIVLAVVASVITEGHFVRAARRRRMQRRIVDLHDHFIICAYGRVGRAVAREFESEGVPFVVVDPAEAVMERMANDGVLHLIEDPTNEATLLSAGVQRARGLITAVDSDSTNVYITMAARALNPDLFIVARASERDSPEHLYRAGANRVISPYVSSGRHMALLSLRPRVVDYLDIAGLGETAMRIEEVRIEAGSPFVGATVAEVCVDSMPLLVRHGDGPLHLAPSGAERLEIGDVLVVVRENVRDELRRS